MSYGKYVNERKEEIENYLEQMVINLSDAPEPLYSSLKYSLFNGGKRLRPLIFLEALKLFTDRELTESDIKFATALESIHTYSLIHDDLPAMDDDDFRRGKPTNHKVYGEGVAILAGDALLNNAYELILESINLASGDIKLYVDAGAIIANNCGSKGLIAGQSLDLFIKDDILTPSKIAYIYQHKTGDLISAAMLSGAIIGGATREEQKLVKDYADNFGYAFQIKDDILDFEEKENRKDQQNFVYIYGITNARSTVIDCIDKAIQSISQLDNKDISFFKKLALKSIERKE